MFVWVPRNIIYDSKYFAMEGELPRIRQWAIRAIRLVSIQRRIYVGEDGSSVNRFPGEKLLGSFGEFDKLCKHYWADNLSNKKTL